MPTYSFTVSYSFNLATHRVVVTDTHLQVFLSSTNELVYDQDYANGKSFRCSGNTFDIGTLTASQVFTRSVDMDAKKAKIWVEEANNANRVIGAEYHDDPAVYNIYNLNQCPVTLSRSGTVAYFKCPCDNESGPCSNTCYTYGN
jgi:hypothetical protein